MERHKSGLVAREFTQQYRKDYYETFIRVIKMGTICISLTVKHGWKLYQMV